MFKLNKTKQFIFLLVFMIFISGCQGGEIIQKIKNLDEKVGESLDKFQKNQQEELINFLEDEEKEKISADNLSKDQKEKIEEWLQANNLNRYGDSVETNYIGGTPLFDEATGDSLDRYDYILKNHPELSDELK